MSLRGFPGGPVIMNPPSNAGHMALIPGRETKIPHAVEQPSWGTTHRVPVLRKIPHDAMKILCAPTKS